MKIETKGSMSEALTQIRRAQAARVALALGMAAVLSGNAAAEEYPARPIRLVVPFAAGGVSDITGRALVSRMQETLGQRFVIDNRGGAGGMIGTDIVAKAAPDGYTLVLASNGTHAVVPHLYKKVPYDPIKDFAPIGMVSVSAQVLGINKDLPIKSLKELVAMAKAKPGVLTYASSGNGSTGHISGEMVAAMAGIQLTHVPYKSASAAYPDVFSGRVSMVFDSAYSMSQHIKGERIRALAVTTPKRTASLPDLPTMSEAGLAGFSMALWVGVFAPAGTPQPVVVRLNKELNRALSTTEIRDQMAQQGAEVVYGTPGELLAAVKGDLKRVGEIVRTSKIEPQ